MNVPYRKIKGAISYLVFHFLGAYIVPKLAFVFWLSLSESLSCDSPGATPERHLKTSAWP
jgi:hypothetical protein